jgi:hypothetical protein
VPSLVGALGAVNSVTAAAPAPTFGAGAPRAAGDLLVLWFLMNGATSVPSPAGWTVAASQAGGTSVSAILYKIATGGDAAPVLTNPGASRIFTMLGEFYGVKNASPVDKSAGAVGSATSPVTATPIGIDTAAGELVIHCGGGLWSAASVGSYVATLNNGQGQANAKTDTATSAVDHYWFNWTTTTSRATQSNVQMAFNVTNCTQTIHQICTFLNGPQTPSPATILRLTQATQAVRDAATRCVKRRPSGILVPRLWTPEPVI